ncbi:MAG: response regulator [Eubacteriales bacterium]|nr:response regulator [Eubacteriales bacterium]
MEQANPTIAEQRSSLSTASAERRTLLDTMQIAMISFLLDQDFTVLWTSEGFCSLVSYEQEAFSAEFPTLRRYYETRPEDFAAWKDSADTAVRTGASRAEATVRLTRGDGEIVWCRAAVNAAAQSPDGGCIAYAVLTDITDVVCAKDEQMRRYEQKSRYFEWMMDEYDGNIYLSDMDTYELLFLNRTACKTLGRPMKQMLGRKCYEVIQGRNEPCPFCTNSRLTEDAFYEWEFFNPVLDRTFMIKNRIINWNGRRTRLELSHDMYSTEFKLAKKDRERDALLKSIPGGFARLDARDFSTVLWYSEGFLELIGYTAEQFETELKSQCAYIHPDDMARAISIMQQIQRTGKSEIIELRATTRAGEAKILTTTLCYSSAEESWDGIPSFYSVGIDVTKEREEQSRQRRALEEAYQTARVASAAKTNFLSTMSHDIRTPMNAIIGMAAIAQANLTAPEKVHDCLNKINVSSRHLLSLINEVLDMSKIESGKIDLTPEDVVLPDLLQNVMDMCRPLLEEKHQQFQVSVGMVRHEKVVVDGDRLRQVFMNLLSNAIKYTPEGGKISLWVNELPSPLPQKGQYEFVFADNGIGMQEEYVKHIFEPFSRAEDSRISKIQGTGLGMAITENIIRMMNGSIEVKSALGEGSRFTVSIPLELRLEEESCDEELAGLPVLVVDDDQIVCESAAALLNELGMRGCWVTSGEEAVACVAAAHSKNDAFFAVILDWKMPGMDGLETIRAIRKNLGEDVPIIIVSAYDYSSIEEEFVRAGADAFITKPLFKSKMLHVLQLFCVSNRIETVNAMAAKKHPQLQGKRVLLAEDNDLNREIAAELLQMQGLAVDAVENGKEAVAAFEASDPGGYAAILMDIQMPVMNGYDAAAVIRALERKDAQTVPILALTANAFAADVSASRRVGMNDHIAKPIDVERLLEVLQRWIS